MRGLYVHIPFCTHICTYCDFVKTMAREEKKARYVDALLQEIERIHPTGFETVHIGGGTPSCLSNKDLKRVIDAAMRAAKNPSEVAIECNPNDITKSKAMMLKRAGVNRVTLGVQTFDDAQLKRLNRSHKAKDVRQAFSLLRACGLHNIAVDLIFGLPLQTLEDVTKDLDRVIQLGPSHISTYELIFEPQTVLYYNYQRGRVLPVDEDDAALMYETIVNQLEKANYKQYEISNFAKDHFVSQHNLLVWRDADYIGVGAGAHSKVKCQRYGNIRSISGYINAIEKGHDVCAFQEPHEGVRDALIMGLRLNEGVHLPTLKSRFGVDVMTRYPEVAKHITEGLLEIKAEWLMLTNRGRLLGNNVFAIF